MANQGHLDILKQGVEVWNQWKKEYPRIRPDLSKVDLQDANLCGAILSGADLSSANLRQAKLDEARLNGANLSYATLDRATIQLADLSRTNLQHANLVHVQLNNSNLIGTFLNNANMQSVEPIGTHFHDADLHDTNLQNALTYATTFSNMDLRSVKGLENIRHEGPSNIGTNTLERSAGDIPEIFLRGAGLSDALITYARSLVVSYHPCFISYAHQDELLARRLHADLQDQGVRCWFAPEDLKIGDKIRARIDNAIHLHEKMLLLLSEHAIASTWVEDEVEAALEKEQRQQHEVLFLIRLDESTMQTTQAWAAKLRRTRHIGDFSNWTDPQAYQHAFKRLLRDLKAEREKDGKPGTS